MADQDMLHTAEIVKAALPFVDARTKVTGELFVKVFELMGSMKNIKGASNLAACGFEAGKWDLEGLLNGIRPLCNLREIEFVDKILNFFKMKRMFETYNNMMEMMKNMQDLGGFGFGESENGTDTDSVTGNFGGSNFESIFQTLKNSYSFGTDTTPQSDLSKEAESDITESGETHDSTMNASNTGSGSNDMMFEMLKTMIPPDKVSTFENLSMLLNTMSYDNNSKPEQKESNDG